MRVFAQVDVATVVALLANHLVEKKRQLVDILRLLLSRQFESKIVKKCYLLINLNCETIGRLMKQKLNNGLFAALAFYEKGDTFIFSVPLPSETAA